MTWPRERTENERGVWGRGWWWWWKREEPRRREDAAAAAAAAASAGDGSEGRVPEIIVRIDPLPRRTGVEFILVHGKERSRDGLESKGGGDGDGGVLVDGGSGSSGGGASASTSGSG
ncbi:hypothetical protein M0804_002274 [Polistes exclamans]|nr:hypothetical protein M0804_002274 [Polistes exclamans]